MKPPQEYTTAGVLMIVSGATNVMLSMMLVLSTIWVCCIGVIWIPSLVIGVLEIATGAMMTSGRSRHDGSIAAMLGVLFSVVNFNVIGVCLEAVAIAMLYHPKSTAWLESVDDAQISEW